MKKRLKNYAKLIFCCVMMFICVSIFSSCKSLSGNQSTNVKLKEKCQVVFDYLGEEHPINFYTIEELTLFNQNIKDDKIYFDEDIVYRVGLYVKYPTGNYYKEFFLGKLDDETVLYYAESYVNDYHETKINFYKCDLNKGVDR